MSEIRELQDLISSWADNVFPGRTLESVALKLYEEIGELLRNPRDAGEHADIYIMMLDLSRMYGVDVAKAVREKMAKNRMRTWERTEIGTLHHIEDGEMDVWEAYQMGARDFRDCLPPRSYDFPIEHAHYYNKGYNDAQHENEGSDLD
jgi:NTP pyrophosphatase (non-canonical NTP hydrolase)